MRTQTLRQLVADHRDEILALAREHGAHDVRVIGSVSRGDDDADSDIDLLVRFEPGRSLFDQAGLVHDLEELLGVEVDVVSEGSLPDGDGAGLDATAL